MNINLTFGAGIPLAAQTALASVESFLNSTFTNNVTINISVGWGVINGQTMPPGDLAASESYISTYSTSSVIAALKAETAANPDIIKSSAIASLASATAPTVELTTAQAKALGLYSSTALDGYIGFDSAATWAFSQIGTIAGNAYDFMGAAEHEITEVLGRQSAFNAGANSIPNLLDFYRYTSSGSPVTGTQVAAGTNNYFSIDHGVTNFGKFNSTKTADLGDWATNAGGAVLVNDAADAYGNPGSVAGFSNADLELLDALGWNWAQAPSATILGQGRNDLSHSSTASGFNHFIDLLNFEASYTDLIAAFGSNQTAMQNWYNGNEGKEQRTETFDGLDYVASYSDLVSAYKVGTVSQVEDSGAQHFITYGIQEGRAITFNGLDYIASYGDLIKAYGANNDAGAYHYIEYGSAEGRKITFDGLNYIASNMSLAPSLISSTMAQTEVDGANNYITQGYSLGLTYSFNGLDYIASYGDLIKTYGANNDAGAYHYIEYGSTERRTTSFDGFSYIAQYTDLMNAYGANEQAGATHYIDYGYSEHRSTSFNLAGYYSAHPDLVGKYATPDAFYIAYINQYESTGTLLV